MLRQVISILFALFLLTSCFGGIDKRGSVKSYYNGIVRTKGGSFKIGTLPDYWEKQRIKYRAILFSNSKDKSTITIDSWCKGAFDDGSLYDLSRDFYKGVSNHKILRSQMGRLGNREALRTDVRGQVDGREIYMSTYVLKLNECVFDFIYVTEPHQMDYVQDFRNLVKGFEFIDGPDIL